MNTKDFLRLGVPLGQAKRLATDFVARFILGGGYKSRPHSEISKEHFQHGVWAAFGDRMRRSTFKL
jgi:hypothetical protein